MFVVSPYTGAMNPYLGAIALAAALVVTSGRATGSQAIEYRGDVLLIEGVEYKREVAREHAKGSVLVSAAEGQLELAEASAARLGLRIKERFKLGHVLVIEVPAGYETQWVAALRRQPGVRDAGVNSIMYRGPAKMERAASSP
jgi:hypothetical protein